MGGGAMSELCVTDLLVKVLAVPCKLAYVFCERLRKPRDDLVKVIEHLALFPFGTPNIQRCPQFGR